MLGGIVFVAELQAAPRIGLDYAFQLELHSEVDNQAVSDVGFDIEDQYRSAKFSAEYDLDSHLLYEHNENEDNTQFEGSLSSVYQANNSIAGIFDADLSEVSTEVITNNEAFSNLETQTLSRLSAGIEFNAGYLVRGEMLVRLLRNRTDYEEAPLDADENVLEVAYTYPVDTGMDVTARLTSLEQNYIDSASSSNDVDILRLHLGLSRSFQRSIFYAYLEQNDVDYSNQDISANENAYGVTLDLTLNSVSSLSAEVSRIVESTFNLNSLLSDPQNPVLQPGLVATDKRSLTYDYEARYNRFSATVYDNSVKDIARSEGLNGVLKGTLVSYTRDTREILKKSRITLAYENLENEITDSESKLATVTASYQLIQNSKINSVLSLTLEDREQDSEKTEDAIIYYEIQAKLY